VLRWPHGGHGDCASARAGYGVRRWARPAGALVGGRFTALQRRQRCCRFEAFTGATEGAPSVPTGARMPKTQVQQKNAVSLALGGAEASGRPCPTPRGPWAPFWAFGYVITDLPPSLPLPRSDPVTRIYESSYRRQ
jgi:hypothetical protein